MANPWLHRYDSELTTAKIRHARSERLHGWSHHLSHDFRKSSRLERVLKKRCNCYPLQSKIFPLPKGFAGEAQALPSADAIRIFYADIQSSHRCPGRCRFSSILRPWWEFLAANLADEDGTPKWEKTSKLGCSGTLYTWKGTLFTTKLVSCKWRPWTQWRQKASSFFLECLT